MTTAITSSEGYYSMVGILSGEYSLACEAEGYEKVVEEFEIGTGESKEQNFKLPLEESD